MPTTIYLSFQLKLYFYHIFSQVKSQKKNKILLVDDEVITLKITRKMLQEHGYEVDMAISSSEAMNFLSNDSYSLVIVDITMPSISGFDLIQLMQSFDYDVPVIFLSNNDNDWTIEESYNIGAKRFVSKEHEFNYLPTIIKEILTTAE